VIIIVDNVPAHLLLLKADGTEQSSAEAQTTTHKWLGFAKGIATKCMRESKRRQAWVSETIKLPQLGSGDTGDTKLRFMMVKAHAPTRYCLIVIRDGEDTTHGIIVTPCSSLSPQGFGSPYTGDEVPDWGTPGFDGGSNLNLSGYEGPSGGHAWQALMVDGITCNPTGGGAHLVYGPDWGKAIGTSRGEHAGYYTDVAFGGSIGATYKTVPLTKHSDVFSVLGNAGAWLAQGEAVAHIAELDHNRQSGQLQYTAGNVPGVGSTIDYSTVTPSPIFKNGRPLTITLHPDSPAVTLADGSASGLVSNSFVGVGALVTGAGKRRIVAIAALRNEYGAFHGDYGLFYMNSPFKKAMFVQAFHVFCVVGGSSKPTAWCFNASCTRASTVAYCARTRSGTDRQGEDYGVLSVETDVVHLDITDEGAAGSITVEECQGCAYAFEQSTDYFESESNAQGGPSSYEAYQASIISGPADYVIAIGYDGDTEKRATMQFTRTREQTGRNNSLKTFTEFNRAIDGLPMASNTWNALDNTRSFEAVEQETVIVNVGATAVPISDYIRETSYEAVGDTFTNAYRWASVNTRYENAFSSAEACHEFFRDSFRALNPAAWDSSGTTMEMEAETSISTLGNCMRLFFMRDGVEVSWGGYFQVLIYRWYYNGVGATHVDVASGSSRSRLFVILSVDLINEELYYAVLDTNQETSPGPVTVTFSVHRNGAVLYTETTGG
jgi:hypothetical protein